jgi:hypothetical protein
MSGCVINGKTGKSTLHSAAVAILKSYVSQQMYTSLDALQH